MKKGLIRRRGLDFKIALLTLVLVFTGGLIFSVVNKSIADAESYVTGKTLAEEIASANDVSKRLADEGFILLKNNMVGEAGSEEPALPIATSAANKAKVSFFGKNVNNPVYNGSGSAGGGSANRIDPYMGLESANFDVNPTLRAFYANNTASGSGRVSPSGMNLPASFFNGETPQTSYTQAVKDSYDEYGDAAIVMFSRVGGEGWDLTRTTRLHADYTGTAEKPHYLMLDTQEKALLKAIKDSGKFKRTVVLLNAATTFQLDFVNDPQYGVDSVLWTGTPGSLGFNALGRILSGVVNPSGKTVDTYYSDFSKDPTWQNFGDNHQATTLANAAQYRNSSGATQNSQYVVEYEEGIYLGYRYYETRGYVEMQAAIAAEAPNPTAWYDNAVVYPFGYGLSYTDFTWEIVTSSPSNGSALAKDGKVEVGVKVKNTGTVPGKDVVELYVNAPYIANQIEKSHVTLGAFAKTSLLAPGAEEIVTLSFDVRDIASYDFADKNANGFKSYELDAGSYNFFIGRNAHDSWASETPMKVTCSVPAGGFQYTESKSGGEIKNRFDFVSNSDALVAGEANQNKAIKNRLMSRADFAGTFPTVITEDELKLSSAQLAMLGHATISNAATRAAYDEGKPWYNDTAPTQRSSALTGTNDPSRIILGDLINVDYDDPLWNEFLNQFTQEQIMTIISRGSYSTGALDVLGVPATRDPDGPVGLTGSAAPSGCTVFVCEVIVAATWNVELAREQGEAIAREGIAGGTQGIYGPAMNIHRSPFSGRNFEYYSECGILSGKIGSAVVGGMSSKGMISFIKHYALNDQETTRYSGLNTWADEQTMREIYLRPFQDAVEKGGSLGFMSSFNRIGPIPASSCYELLTGINREEWGFKGVIVTDMYGTNYGHNAAHLIRSGNDLILNNMNASNWGTTYYITATGGTNTEKNCVRQAAKNILYAVSRSNAMMMYSNGSREDISFVKAAKDTSISFQFGTGSLVYNGTPTINYAIAGALPEGVTFNANSRTISGVPSEGGTFEVQLLISRSSILLRKIPVTLTVELSVDEKLDAANLKIEELEDKIADLEDKMSDIEDALEAAGYDDTALKAQIADLEDMIADLEEALEAAGTGYDDTALKAKITTLEGKISDLEDTIADLEDALAAAGYDDTALKGRISTLEGKVSDLEDTIADLEAALEAAGYDDTALKAQIAELEGELAALYDALEAVGGDGIIDLSELIGKVNTLESKVTALEGKIADLEAALEAAGYDDTAIKARITTLEGKVATLEAALEAAGYDDTALLAEIAALKGDIADLEAAIEAAGYDDTALKARITTLEGKIAALEAAGYDDTALKARIAELEGKVADLEEALEAAGYDDTALKAQIAELEEMIADLEAAGYDDTALKARVTALEEKIAGYDAKIKDLEDRIKALEANNGCGSSLNLVSGSFMVVIVLLAAAVVMFRRKKVADK